MLLLHYPLVKLISNFLEKVGIKSKRVIEKATVE